MIDGFDAVTLATVAAIFVLAGGVKGVIGLGLPTVSLGLLTATQDLPTAMALMVAPSFVTNLWQGAVGGHASWLIAKIWPFLLVATVVIWFGAQALVQVELAYLSALLGLLLIAYAGISLLGFRLSIRAPHHTWSGIAFGAVNGVLTGMTGSFVVPGVMYLQAIGLTRDQLVQAMGMLFTVSTVGVAVALDRNSLYTSEMWQLSALGVVPAIIGMVIGQQVRKRISEQRFRQVFFTAILLLGTYIISTALFFSS